MILVVFIARQVYDIYLKQNLSKDNLASVLNENIELQNREKMLSSEIERLKTKDGIEEEIRNKFNVVRPGESVVVIVENTSTSKKDLIKEKEGWWESFLKWMR
jgi:cell division protein FtsB